MAKILAMHPMRDLHTTLASLLYSWM